MMFKLIRSTAFENWVNELRDKQVRNIIAARLTRLENGAFGDARTIAEGVRELRIHFGPGYRVYFQQRGNEIILLLCGGDKSTQSADIKRAVSIARDWEIR
jgi:putative addiction module killer protein